MNVRVTNAPGYADFDGILLMEVPNAMGEPMSVVGWELEGERDYSAFPSIYVTEIEGA